MGKKLLRSAEVWFQRIKMGRARLWAVVEGKEFDTPFYEQLAERAAGGSRIEILLAEHLSVDGASAGGKGHAKKIYELGKQRNALHQVNRASPIDVVFFLDSDDDRYLGAAIVDDHIIYTEHSDIEAELVSRANLHDAVKIAFALPRSVVEDIALAPPLDSIADSWREWVVLRLASASCGWADARFAQKSPIHAGFSGPVDESKRSAICARVESAVADWPTHLRAAEIYVSSAEAAGTQAHLVKGKWVAGYVSWIVKTKTSPRALPTVSDRHFLGVCLATIDFDAPWAETYLKPLRKLTAA